MSSPGIVGLGRLSWLIFKTLADKPLLLDKAIPEMLKQMFMRLSSGFIVKIK
jgi:hypothetical protein